MDIQATTVAQGRITASSHSVADEIKLQRGHAEKVLAEQGDNGQIQPEELLHNIKALTKDGLYSVRFEINNTTQDLVINLIDQETGEIIRQVPPEEVVSSHQRLADLRGNIVETES